MSIHDTSLHTVSPTGPEFGLVTAALAADFDEDAKERLRRHVRESLDWERVVTMVQQRRVAPIVHRNLLKYCCLPPVSAEYTGMIGSKAESQREWTKNLLREAIRISEALRSHGISVVYPKGPSMCALAPEPYCRAMADLDILIADGELSAALAVLEEMGYVLCRESDFEEHVFLPVDEAGRGEILNRAGHVEYLVRKLPTGEQVILDLNTTKRHYELHLVDLGEVMQDARKLSLEEGKVLAPCHEDAVIILSYHLRKHGLIPSGRCRLPLRDVAELYRYVRIYNDHIDWGRVLDKVRRYSTAYRQAWRQLESEAQRFAASRGVACNWAAPPYWDPMLGLTLSLKAVAALYSLDLPADVSALVASSNNWQEDACEVWTSYDFAIYEWTGSYVERMALDGAAQLDTLWRAGLVRERARLPEWAHSFLFVIGIPSRVKEPADRASQ